MTAFGTMTQPVRTVPPARININAPDGFMTDPPGAHWYWGLYDSWTTQLPPALTRGTSLLVNPLVRMPWVVTTSDGTQLRPTDLGYPVWLRDPQMLNGSTGGPSRGTFAMLDRADRFSVFARWITSALWVGVGVMAFSPDSAGQPRAGSVQILAASRLYRSATEGWALAMADGSVQPIDDDGMVAGQRIVVIRHSLPGGVLGWHRSLLQMTERMGKYAANTYDSAVPSGVLSTDQALNQEQADQARTEWTTRQTARSVAVLGNGTRYQQVVASPVDVELVAMSRLSNENWAHALELPAFMLDAAQSGGYVYQNSQEVRQDMVDGPLASWAARLEETVSALMPWGWRMSVDFTEYRTVTTTTEAPNAPLPAAS